MTALRSPAGAAVLALVTIITWYAWLGHDTEYQIDANGNQTGPYTTSQVVGCVLTLLALLVAAVLLRVHPLVAAAALTVAFTGAWTVQAARSDDSGLFVVGAILVFAGTAAASIMVAYLASALNRR